MKKLFNILKEKLAPLSSKLQSLKSILPQKKPHSEKYYKRIAFLNKYSLIFHFLLACLLILAVETISRRDFVSAITFISNHTLAFLYNALIIFASLSLVYLTKYRTQMRILISGLWIFLGTVNGLILSNRVTPFSYTDLKCLPDLFAMQNTNYFTAEEATMVVSVVVAFFVILGLLFAKGPRYQGKRHTVLGPVSIAALILIGLPITTQAAQSSNILASYFANIAQGYSDYGFVYGFSTSVVGRGMDKPEDYSEETVDAINTLVDSASSPTTVSTGSEPNVICVLLESFCDPYEVNFLNMSEDPIPNFHNLEANYSTGYLTVPVVGAGTANTEFEVLTGMSMQYFGTGEYPYKTILKQTDCESIADDLSQIGYGTHVVHNNTATFYSRNNAFSMMGFDTFTSKECMNISQYTPNGNWPTDDVLVQETVKAVGLHQLPGQVGIDVLGIIAGLQDQRLPVHITHPGKAVDLGALLQLHFPAHIRRRHLNAEVHHGRRGDLAHRGNLRGKGVAHAFGPGIGVGHEGALAPLAHHQPLLLQLSDGLSHGVAADVHSPAQLRL